MEIPDVATARVPALWLRALDTLITPGRRCLLGLVGPPGAGKSTLAAALHRARPGLTVVVPMDGFHLRQAELVALGRAQRKGAPDTFDAPGYVALLQALRQQRPGDPDIDAPAFSRAFEEPVAAALTVPASVPLVITEGNYLLLDDEPWCHVAGLLDEVWYVDLDDATRVARLTARHVAHGRSPEAAKHWVTTTDEPNAARIGRSRHRATHRVRWGTDSSGDPRIG